MVDFLILRAVDRRQLCHWTDSFYDHCWLQHYSRVSLHACPYLISNFGAFFVGILVWNCWWYNRRSGFEVRTSWGIWHHSVKISKKFQWQRCNFSIHWICHWNFICWFWQSDSFQDFFPLCGRIAVKVVKHFCGYLCRKISGLCSLTTAPPGQVAWEHFKHNCSYYFIIQRRATFRGCDVVCDPFSCSGKPLTT